MNATVILNPTAGRAKSQNIERDIRDAFRKHCVDCVIVCTERAGDACSLARKAADAGSDVVVSAGGDGTLNEVANGIAGTGAALGVIPVGTVNVFARDVRIPLNIHKAAEVIASGRTRNMDLGVANRRYFILMAGLGFDAEVVANVVKPLKDVIGGPAYVLKGLEMLARYQPTEVTLEMPERTYTGKAYVVVAANSPSYAYALQIAPYARADDGLLDVLVFEEPFGGNIGFVRQILEIFIRRHTFHRSVRYFKTSSVTVTSHPHTSVQLDGDSFGHTPVEISVAPGILPVIVP